MIIKEVQERWIEDQLNEYIMNPKKFNININRQKNTRDWNKDLRKPRLIKPDISEKKIQTASKTFYSTKIIAQARTLNTIQNKKGLYLLHKTTITAILTYITETMTMTPRDITKFLITEVRIIRTILEVVKTDSNRYWLGIDT